MGRVMASEHRADHLQAIDAEAWPGVAAVPSVSVRALRARRAEAAFAAAVSRAGLRFENFEGEEPDLTVRHAEVFDRIAAGGWIGLAEGYLAGEWETATSAGLVRVLRGLIEAKYRPKTLHLAPAAQGGAEPAALVAHYSGDGVSPFQGHFATGVPTTERTPVKSFARGAGKRGTPARHFVDVTEYGEPLPAGRGDLADAQSRSAEMLLDAAGVTAHTHLLVQPAAGGALAIAAAQRGATVDCAVPEGVGERMVREALVYAGAAESVRVVPAAQPAARSGYEAVVSAEYLETLPPRRKAAYLREVEAALSPGGRAALQTIVATESMSRTALAALESLRAYIWPGLCFSTPTEIAQIVDRNTHLRVVAETRAPRHLERSLALQRTTFDANLRDAAADGFDPVYRRLWTWQLALREALAQLGMLDVAQVVLVGRHRGGRR